MARRSKNASRQYLPMELAEASEPQSSGSPRASSLSAVALLFGLALVPVAGLMGLALDSPWSSSPAPKFQNAVNSAGLQPSRRCPETRRSPTFRPKRKKWVAASLVSKGVDPPAIVSNSPHPDGRHGSPEQLGLHISRRSLDVGITLFNVVAKHEDPSASRAMTVAASNEVDWSLGNVEVDARAWTITGSMAGTKLANLKTDRRGNSSSSSRKAKTKPGQVKISLVPFSQAVRGSTPYTRKRRKTGSTGPLAE